MCLVALKHIFPEVPVNGGAFRPARFTIPEGTHAGGRVSIAGRRHHGRGAARWSMSCSAALAQAIPDAGAGGPVRHHGGRHALGPRPGERRAITSPCIRIPAATAAAGSSDGLVNGTPPGSMAKFMSVEMSEHRYPLRFDYYRIREDSGGAARIAAAAARRMGITALADCVLSVLGDRVDHLPSGCAGRRPGGGERGAGADEWRTLAPPFRSKIERHPAGGRATGVRLASPGGGGSGRPAGARGGGGGGDLDAGLIDREAAEGRYGVVVASAEAEGDRVRYRIDRLATQARRMALR